VTRITLLITDPTYLAFCLYWTQPLIADQINIEIYDPKKTYSTKNTAFYVSYLEFVNAPSLFLQQKLEQGYKIISDHLWDSDVDTVTQITDCIMTLRNVNWLWYYSCIEWQHYGYKTYQSQPDYKHVFFMPMNRQEWHRDQLINSLAPVLDRALYSYVAQGHLLADDIPATGRTSWRAYFNPNWYNQTCFSVVAESYMRTDNCKANSTDLNKNYRTEVSEKIFKPMMGRHPFIVFGSVDTLKYLHREGFESFENLFDQTYDTVLLDHARHQAATESVLQAVRDYDNQQLSIDTLTQEKIAHNHARLFDIDLVKNRVRNEIMTEILEFVET